MAQSQPAEDGMTWIRHRSATRMAGESGIASGAVADDEGIVSRLRTAYQAAVVTPVGSSDSIWLSTYGEEKNAIHEVLIGDGHQSVADMLRNPAENTLFYGFDNLNKNAPKVTEDWWRAWQRDLAYDNLVRTAEAVGSLRMEYPEAPPRSPPLDPEDILCGLDAVFGFQVKFPNPYPTELGLHTSRGVASYRAIQALYQAYRISELVQPGARVVEIGGGLGRTAYYGAKFGLTKYTIIDIPMTCVAQGYFLARTLGSDVVQLFGEHERGLRVLPPSAFMEADDRYDIVVNVDSLTELAPSTAVSYCHQIKRCASVFLSINHEYNALTSRDICKEAGFPTAHRAPYWLRRGYVEEVYWF